MNQSILCNCNIEAESNFLLESLAACEGSETKTYLEMHFTLNLAFVNYFDNMMEELGIPISRNWTTQEQILPLSLETFEINPIYSMLQKHCENWQFNTEIKEIL